ncbi:MAG: 2-amino-4-oxopentanoate thiolase subunit OrtA [Tenericutes bacterium]|nr:2-amino-4-oxopentanoate thiolase subunit OrtA [Mycoplasmatota bacterium]
MIKKNTWVKIKKTILKPEERTGNIPEETKKVPLLMWVKGYLLENANIGDEVEINTLTGRKETGKLLEANPAYMHTYGKFVPEILDIDRLLKDTLFGGETNE